MNPNQDRMQDSNQRPNTITPLARLLVAGNIVLTILDEFKSACKSRHIKVSYAHVYAVDPPPGQLQLQFMYLLNTVKSSYDIQQFIQQRIIGFTKTPTHEQVDVYLSVVSELLRCSFTNRYVHIISLDSGCNIDDLLSDAQEKIKTLSGSD